MLSDCLDPSSEDFWGDGVDLPTLSRLLDFILEEVADLEWEIFEVKIFKLLDGRCDF